MPISAYDKRIQELQKLIEEETARRGTAEVAEKRFDAILTRLNDEKLKDELIMDEEFAGSLAKLTTGDVKNVVKILIDTLPSIIEDAITSRTKTTKKKTEKKEEEYEATPISFDQSAF